MKIVLLKDIKNLGKPGDILDLKDGYARYLINNKSAKKATPGAINEVKIKQKAKERELEELKKQAQKIFNKINNQVINIKIAAGISGKPHESVTNAKVSDALKKEFGVNIEKRKISFENSGNIIKTFGMHSAIVQLFHGITANISINILETNE